MFLISKHFKGVVFSLLLVVFIFSLAGPVFALDLEVDYPSVPGIGSLEQGQELEDKGERAAFYARYVLRLVFYIVLGVCVAVIIAAGVMYITAGAKPTAIVAAKAMVQRALLGLGILVGSYLILYTINPELVVLRVKIEEPGPIEPSSAAEPAAPGEVRGYYINPTQVALETLEDAATPVEHLPFGASPEPGKFYYDDSYNPIVGTTKPVTLGPKQGLLARILNKLRPGSVSAGDSPEVAPWVYRAELPLRQTEKIVEEMIELVDGVRDADNKVIKKGLEDLLWECKCGESKWHTKWGWELEQKGSGLIKTYSASYEGKCLGGMSEAQEGLFWNDHEETPRNTCLTNCKDCGTSRYEKSGELKCDLREIRAMGTTIAVGARGEKNIELVFIKTKEDDKKTLTKDDSEWAVIDWRPLGWTPDIGWKPYGEHNLSDFGLEGDGKVFLAPSTAIDKDKSIQYKRYRLQQLLARLEGQKAKYFPEQIGPVEKTLANNAADYLLFNVKGGMFQNDFVAQKKIWEDQGLIVNMEPIKSATGVLDEQINTVAYQQSAFDRFLSFFIKPVAAQFARYNIELQEGTFYFVVSAPREVVSPDLTAQNQFVYREASRASLFSVLTDLSLEKIQAMFQRCLTAAFGEADYHITDEHISSVLQKALEGGVADEFIEQLKQDIPKIVESIGKTYGSELQGRIDLGCAKDCGFVGGSETIEEFIERKEENKKCVDECIKENISPDFTSRTVTSFLTADIDTWFGKKAKDKLDSPIREALGGDINKQLDKEMGRFYDTVFKGLLSQSLEEKIPGLKDMLSTKLTEVKFLDVVLGRLKAVDEFLTCKLSGCCRAVAGASECVEEVYDELPGDIKQCGTAETGFRNVASKHQCKKEVFREKDGKRQCCEQGLRQKIDAFAEDKVSALARKYTSEKATDLIEGLKQKRPGLFPEYLSVEECFKRLKQGYRFVAKAGGAQMDNYECEKMSPEMINALTTVFTGDPTSGLMEFNIVDEMKPDICRGAGYCWDRDPDAGDIYQGDGAKKCRECQWIGQGFTKGQGMGGIRAGLESAGRDFAGGLVNFAEQFISALVETTLHMAIQYAKVWIEDTITAPLMPYFKQVMKLQDKLHQYLNASVRDVLPEPVRETLEKNLDTLIGDMCKAYEEQEKVCEANNTPDEQCEFTFEFAQYPWLRWEDASGNPVPIRFSKTSQISDNFGEKVCKFNQHLHTTLLDEIAASHDFAARVAEALNNTIKEELAYACKVEVGDKKYTCTDLLEMNLAEMIFAFTPLKNIIDLINGTPKEIICGEKDVKWQKDDGTSDSVLPSAKCKDLLFTGQLGSLLPERGRSGSLTKFYETLLSPINLTLPFINKKGAAYQALSPGEKDFYKGYCPAVWGICKKISPSALISEATIGEAISQILDKGCSLLAQTLKEGLTMKDKNGNDVRLPVPPPPLCPQGDCLETPVCEGTCLSGNAADSGLRQLQQDADPQCLSAFKQTCSGCNTLLNNTIAYSWFYYMIKKEFVLPGGRDAYPNPPLIPDLTSLREREGEAYQWLYIYFPSSEPDIARIAKARNFDNGLAPAWQDLKQDVLLRGDDVVRGEIEARGLINGFINSFRFGTVKNILTNIPLGVVKPMKAEEATILRPAGSGEARNFLAKTPFGLLTNDVCGKVVYDFENDENLKYWSLPEVGIREELALGTAPRYSMDSLESSTLAKNLDIVLHSPVDAEQKVPYLFCKALKYSPAQVAGLSEKLMTYIRPKQVQIMFELIDDKLHYSPNPRENEMPKKLKQLIDYLNTRTPSGALVDVANKIHAEPGGQLNRLFSVHVDYRPDRDLRRILSEPGNAIKEAFRNNGLGLLGLFFFPVSDIQIGDTNNVMGLYADREGKSATGFYVIKTTTDEKVFLVVYYDPAKIKGALNSFVKFLNTSVQGLIFERLAEREALFAPIIDTICEQPFEIEGLVYSEEWCSKSIPIAESALLNWLRAFIRQRPIDLVTNGLKYKLIDCEGDKCDWKKSVSIMDWLVKKYPFLGEKYIDTLGRKIGWDVQLFHENQYIHNAQDLIDASITNIETAVQDKLNVALIEKPAQAVDYVTRGLANLIGGKAGENLADQLTGDDIGACSTVYTESACKQEGKVYRAATGDEPSQCCALGANVVCAPRCRVKPNNKPCNEDLGETEVQLPTEEQLGLHCCLGVFDAGDYEGQCKVCRLIPAVDDAADRGCREGEVKQGGLGELQVCCKPKTRVIKTDENGKTIEDKCCTTVVGCVADQFDEHLRVLAETMAQGSLPLNSLTD